MEFYFDGSLFGWMVKDSFSNYAYANEQACRYFNCKKDEIIGCSDADLIPDLGSSYKYILSDDKKIMATARMSIVLKVFDYGGQNRLKAYLVEKRPWILADNSPGVICTYIELTNVYFSTFLRQHTRRPLVFEKPSSIFTEREWEVILLLLCGMKRNIMSDILNISTLTLRNRISRCCEKAGVINESELSKYCYSNGWDNYIPPFFLKKRYINIIK